MADGISTTLIVFGRGLTLGPTGQVTGLSEASAARVAAALDHVAAHAEAFAARRHAGHPGLLIFSGGWAAAAAGLAPPPVARREGRLMLEAARSGTVRGAPVDAYADTVAEVESGSTLENVVHLHRQGLLAGRTFTADDPLGLVGHAEHLPRIDHLTRKVLRLPSDAVQHLAARGPDLPSPHITERTLHRLTLVMGVGARRPAALQRRERLLRGAARLRRLTTAPARQRSVAP